MARETVVTYTCARCRVSMRTSTSGAQLPDLSIFLNEGWTAHTVADSFTYLDLCGECSEAMEKIMTKTRDTFIAEFEDLEGIL